jgi:hypothetical protein
VSISDLLLKSSRSSNLHAIGEEEIPPSDYEGPMTGLWVPEELMGDREDHDVKVPAGGEDSLAYTECHPASVFHVVVVRFHSLWHIVTNA